MNANEDDDPNLESILRAVAATPKAVPPPQGLIGDRFVLIRKLGAGAFGLVYEVKDLLDGRRVALKVLRHAEAEWLDCFKREFRALQDLAHPNLIALDELFFLDGRWFFTMELLDGVDLVRYVRHGAGERTNTAPQLNEDRLRVSVRQLLEALAVLHAAGKVHRDVKPSNVLVTTEGRAVLLDFGLVGEALDADPTTRRSILGTPLYMAPEQAAMRGVGPEADMYAVGVMLYELLAGRPPFEGDHSRLLIQKSISDPRPVGEIASVPADLAALTSNLLKRIPTDRPTALEALALLGAARVSGPVPSSRSTRMPSGIERDPLVGRQPQLKLLSTAFEACRQEQATIVHISGVSGIGKTALVQEFCDGLRREERALVLSGRCYERESVPFKGFDSLVDSIVLHLRQLPERERARIVPDDLLFLERMFPVIGVLEGRRTEPLDDRESLQETRNRAFVALRTLLSRLSEGRRVVLWLDDVHWADADSAALLNAIFHSPRPSALFVILTYRAQEGTTSAFLGALRSARRENTEELQTDLGPLPAAAVRTLAAHLLGQEHDRGAPTIDLFVREADGNPFFMTELASFLREGVVADTEAALLTLDLSLEHVLTSRVRRLPPTAQRLLEVAAVAGTPISLKVASLAAGLSEDAHKTLAILRTARLVRTWRAGQSDVLTTYHDRIAETITEALAPDELRARHMDIAASLEQTGDSDSEMLVVHFRAAGEPRLAGKHAVRAAHVAASMLAFERAARLYRLALEFGIPESQERESIEVALGDALANKGSGKEAAAVYLDTAERASAERAFDLRRRAGEQLLRSGHVDEGFATLDSVLGAVGIHTPASPRAALVSLLTKTALLSFRGYEFKVRREEESSKADLARIDACWSATIAAGTVDTIRGAEVQARHLLLALKLGEPYRVARAMCVQTAHVSSQGYRSRVLFEKLSARTERLARESGHPHAVALAALAQGMGACFLGDTSRALERCAYAEDLFRRACTGVAWEIATAQIFAHHALASRGKVGVLHGMLTTRSHEARDRGDRYAAWTGLCGFPVIAHLAADRPVELRGQLSEALAHWSNTVFTVQHNWAAVANALLDLYTGEQTNTLARLEVENKRHASSQLFRVELVRINFRLSYANCALAQADGRSGPALELAARLCQFMAREKVDWGRPFANLLGAAIDWAYGRKDAAAGKLRRAIDQFDVNDMALFAAASRRRLGQILGGDEGRELLANSNAFMIDESVVNVPRLSRVLTPGYPEFD